MNRLTKAASFMGCLGFSVMSRYLLITSRSNILVALASADHFDVLEYVFYFSLVCLFLSFVGLFSGRQYEKRPVERYRRKY